MDYLAGNVQLVIAIFEIIMVSLVVKNILRALYHRAVVYALIL